MGSTVVLWGPLLGPLQCRPGPLADMCEAWLLPLDQFCSVLVLTMGWLHHCVVPSTLGAVGRITTCCGCVWTLPVLTYYLMWLHATPVHLH
jgi:hypothetical protein